MMKTTTFLMCLLMLALNYRAVFAFQDIYEPDDNAEQANRITVDDEKLQQHTLDSGEDEDWFKFYAAQGIQYDLIVETVGADINVVLEFYDSDGVTKLERSDDDGNGKKEALSWRTQSEGWYFAKISDKLNSSAPTCRQDIQYQLRVTRSDAPSFNGKIRGTVIDALSGQPIKYAIIYACGNQNAPTPSFEDGSYDLHSKDGFCELTAKVKDGAYKPLSCHIQIPELFPIIRNMPLLPSGQNVPALSPSKTVYQHGEQLRVEFQSVGLPPQSCIRYYFGIAYPDGRFFIITQLNRFELFDWVYLPQWTGQQNVIIDKQIDNDMPRGEYLLYILRMPEGINDPINNLDKGELNVSSFRIEE